ncbi:MAG: HD domain-containing protein [bacterium]|nr:HD domain-containing protein [bacterium]
MRDTLRSIQRLLLRRIVAITMLSGVFFGAIAFVAEKGRVDASVGARADSATRSFNVLAQATLDRSGPLSAAALQRDLDRLAGRGFVERDFGQFVRASVRDLSGKVLARAGEGGLEPAADLDSVLPIRIEVEGRPHLLIAVPLLSSAGEVVAYIEGLFRVSDSGLTLMRRQVLRTVGSALLIVIVSAAAIYPIILSLVRRLTRMTVNLLDANLETLQALGGAIAKRDNETDAHNCRVTIYSVRLAEHVALPEDRIRSLIKGALIHDVGKIAIRDEVLLKPGKLDDDEYAVMKTHVEHGLDITARSSWLTDGADVVGSHHEKYDGGGYPKGASGQGIPVVARIFAIADVFDALASRRPYKEPCTYEETMAILEQGRGSHFDPELLDAFGTIARGLHGRFAGVDGPELQVELESLIRRYFHSSMRELLDDERDADEAAVETAEPALTS